MVTDERAARGFATLSRVEVIERLSADALRDIGVDGLSVAIVGLDGPSVAVHATDRVSAQIEEIQFTLGEGPGLDARRTGSPVLIDDLESPAGGTDGRWPMFRPEARRLGVHALFAFPIRIGAISLGTVDMQRAAPGPLDARQLGRALSTVDAIGSSLLGPDAGRSAGGSAGGSETPQEDVPTYPMTVHQAAGMAMVQLGCSIREALVRLRATAYAENVPLGELASDIVAGRRRMQREEA